MRALVPAARFRRPGFFGGFPSQSKRGGQSADRRWMRNAAPRDPPCGRADLGFARDHRPMTLAGAPLGAPPRRLFAGPRFRPEAVGLLAQALRPSASSWQGAVVPPGGAPAPPECRGLREPRPAGAAPAEARDFPRRRPPKEKGPFSGLSFRFVPPQRRLAKRPSADEVVQIIVLIG